MAILLDHVVVPAHNRIEAAHALAGLLGVPWERSQGAFTPVYVNESLTLDFADRALFEGHHHFCFHVSDEDFAGIFDRLKAAGIKYRSSPRGEDDMTINTRLGGKNVYWQDVDGHLWEILTVSYARQDSPVAGGATPRRS